MNETVLIKELYYFYKLHNDDHYEINENILGIATIKNTFFKINKNKKYKESKHEKFIKALRAKTLNYQKLIDNKKNNKFENNTNNTTNTITTTTNTNNNVIRLINKDKKSFIFYCDFSKLDIKNNKYKYNLYLSETNLFSNHHKNINAISENLKNKEFKEFAESSSITPYGQITKNLVKITIRKNNNQKSNSHYLYNLILEKVNLTDTNYNNNNNNEIYIGIPFSTISFKQFSKTNEISFIGKKVGYKNNKQFYVKDNDVYRYLDSIFEKNSSHQFKPEFRFKFKFFQSKNKSKTKAFMDSNPMATQNNLMTTQNNLNLQEMDDFLKSLLYTIGLDNSKFNHSVYVENINCINLDNTNINNNNNYNYNININNNNNVEYSYKHQHQSNQYIPINGINQLNSNFNSNLINTTTTTNISNNNIYDTFYMMLNEINALIHIYNDMLIKTNQNNIAINPSNNLNLNYDYYFNSVTNTNNATNILINNNNNNKNFNSINGIITPNNYGLIPTIDNTKKNIIDTSNNNSNSINNILNDTEIFPNLANNMIYNNGLQLDNPKYFNNLNIDTIPNTISNYGNGLNLNNSDIKASSNNSNNNYELLNNTTILNHPPYYHFIYDNIQNS
eukprot:jgi/Orpsp1_1/1180305/evm.model.c7180000072856.1